MGWGTRSEPGRAAVQALGGLVVENRVRPKTSCSPQLRGFAPTGSAPQAELGRFCKVLRHFDGLDWASKNIWDPPKESGQSRSKAATCLSLQSCLIMNIFTNKRSKISFEQKENLKSHLENTVVPPTIPGLAVKSLELAWATQVPVCVSFSTSTLSKKILNQPEQFSGQLS